MRLADALTAELTEYSEQGIRNKKQAFEIVAKMLSQAAPEVRYQTALHALNERERLGSTYIDYGVAIPHGRLAELERPTAVLLGLKDAISYDDTHSAQVLLALFVPEDATTEHLELLKNFALKLKQSSYREHLMQAHDSNTLYQAAIATC